MGGMGKIGKALADAAAAAVNSASSDRMTAPAMVVSMGILCERGPRPGPKQVPIRPPQNRGRTEEGVIFQL